jgi:hypothetical protein
MKQPGSGTLGSWMGLAAVRFESLLAAALPLLFGSL